MVRKNSQVWNILNEKAQRAEATGKKVKIGKPTRQKSTKSLELEYYKFLLPICESMKKAIDDHVVKYLPQLIMSGQYGKPKTDSFSDDLDFQMKQANLQFYGEYNEAEVTEFLRRHGYKVSIQNLQAFQQQFKKALGVNPILSEGWMQDHVKDFTKRNVKLIETIPEDYFNKIELRVSQMVQQGRLQSEITDEILKIYEGAGPRRAAVIARDQTSKFYGELTKLRHAEVGVDSYIWSTSMDERVRGNPGGKYPKARPSHWAREGQVFKWSEPPEDGHPREPIMCVPDFENVSIHSLAKKAFRRWYDGELTQIVSDSGNSLNITPNHPVLTLRGWQPAHLVKVGDYLIEAPNQNIQIIVSDPQGRNSQAGKMFSTLQQFGLLQRIPNTALGFHGDATNQDVDVVKINRNLLLNGVTETSKLLCEDILAGSDNTRLPRSLEASFLVTDNSSFIRSISSGNEPHPFCFSSLGHPQKHGGTSPAMFNSVFDKNPSNSSSITFELFSDSFLAHSVLVKPDDFIFRKVQAVRRKSFCGFVHNFETVTGWYSASNLIVHNCRCEAIPVFDDGSFD